jgi:hypothetical protein
MSRKRIPKLDEIVTYLGCIDKRNNSPYYLAQYSYGEIWVLNGDYNIKDRPNLFVNLLTIFPNMEKMGYIKACNLINQENSKIDNEDTGVSTEPKPKPAISNKVQEQCVTLAKQLFANNYYKQEFNNIISHRGLTGFRNNIYEYLVGKGRYRTAIIDQFLKARGLYLPSEISSSEAVLAISTEVHKLLIADLSPLARAKNGLIDLNNVTEEKHTNKKENKMLNSIRTEIKYLINGEDATEMSMDKLLSTVVNIEDNIKKLGAIETKSKAIAKEILKQNATLTFVVKHLDANYK